MAGRGDSKSRKGSRDQATERYYSAPLSGRISRASSKDRTTPRPPTSRRNPSRNRLTPQDSPDRHGIRWPEHLEIGPTPSDPLIGRRASQSPSRSAMANPTSRNSRLASTQLEIEDAQFRFESLDEEEKNRKRDQNLCQEIGSLRVMIDHIAQEISSPQHIERTRTTNVVEKLCEDVENAQLLRYIGCLAMGGPCGIDDWNEMLAHPLQVKALVMGIVSRALREKVFNELWFGSSKEQIIELENQEDEMKDYDGFERTRERAAKCLEWFQRKVDPNLDAAEAKLCLQLEKILKPLYEIRTGTRVHFLPSLTRDRLRDVVQEAARSSRQLRTYDDVVYYWPPTFKDEEFDPQRMECLNTVDMIEGSPYKKRTVNGHATAVLDDKGAAASRDEAIVRIVAFPGIVAYRQEGGPLAKKLLAEEKKHDNRAPPDVRESRRHGRDGVLDGTEGFRTKVICKSIVYLIWGKQRLLTREAGTSAHLDAKRDGREEKYNADRQGFVELYDVFMHLNPQAAAAMAM